MARIELIKDEQAQGKAKELLDGAKAQIGMVPNLFRALANSPAALENYMTQSQVLSGGLLDAKLREQLALTIAGVNECNYCASAHTAIGAGAGISKDELTQNLMGKSADEKTQAALNFAKAVMNTKGNVSDAELSKVREAGFGSGEIAEIVAHVAMNTFTNYFNHVADTEIDFPVVKTCGAKACAA